MLKNITIDKFQELFMLIQEPIVFDNQYVYISNICITGDCVLFILLGKEFSSLK